MRQHLARSILILTLALSGYAQKVSPGPQIPTAGGPAYSPTFGSITGAALSTPAAPTITPTCTGTCATTYSYLVVALLGDGTHSAASSAGSTSAQASTLDSTHSNSIATAAVSNARSCDVYRSVGGSSQGKIGNVPCGSTLVDTGLAGDSSTAPSSNTTGGATFAGPVTIGTTVQVPLACDDATDNLARINSAISTRMAGVAVTVSLRSSGGAGACMISAPITILSNTSLIVDRYTTIKLVANGVVTGGASFAQNSDFSGGNTNIFITGGIWDGNQPNQPAWTLTATADITGVGFRLRNVANLRIADLTIKNPTAYGIHCEQCSNATVENITLDYNGSVAQDGIHFNGPWSNITVRNIVQVGTAGDDTVALEADGGLATPYMTHGDGVNALVDGIVVPTTNNQNGIRINQSSHNVTNVTIRHLSGNFPTKSGILFDIPVGYGCPGGLVNSPCSFSGATTGIVLEDIKASACTNIINYTHVVVGINTADVDDTCGPITGSTATYTRNGPGWRINDGVAILGNAFANFIALNGAQTAGIEIGYDAVGGYGIIAPTGQNKGLRFLTNNVTTGQGSGVFLPNGYFGVGPYAFSPSVPLHVKLDGVTVSGTLAQIGAIQNTAGTGGVTLELDTTGPSGGIGCTGATCGVFLRSNAGKALQVTPGTLNITTAGTFAPSGIVDASAKGVKLPTSCTGLASGTLYNNAGTPAICP